MSAGKARAAVLTQPQGPFELKSFQEPEPKEGELLLTTELAGVCASDVHIYHGTLPGIAYPLIPGHEYVGRIKALGFGVTKDTQGLPVQEGDRVIPMPATPNDDRYENIIAPGPILDYPEFDVVGFTEVSKRPLAGAWSETVHCSARTRFFKTSLPANIAVLTEPFATPVHALQRAGIAPGATVVVQGAGVIGLLSIAAARSAGASKVIVTGGPKRRLEVAQKFGADVTINIDEVKDAKERVQLVKAETVGGRGADLVIEAAGVPSAFIEGLEYLRNGGRFAEIGHFADAGSVAINPSQHLVRKDVTLIASSGYGPLHYLQAIRLLEQNAFPYELLVTHQLSLSEVEDALLALTPQRGWKLGQEEVVKITINPTLT